MARWAGQALSLQPSARRGLHAYFEPGKGSIDFRGHHEVTLCQAVNGVRPEIDPHLTPAHVQVGVVALALGNRCDGVHKIDRLDKITELEALGQLLVFLNAPALELDYQRL